MIKRTRMKLYSRISFQLSTLIGLLMRVRKQTRPKMDAKRQQRMPHLISQRRVTLARGRKANVERAVKENGIGIQPPRKALPAKCLLRVTELLRMKMGLSRTIGWQFMHS
jgi:hypothetical protein